MAGTGRPAKSASDDRAGLAGSVEDRPSRRYLPGSWCSSRAPARECVKTPPEDQWWEESA